MTKTKTLFGSALLLILNSCGGDASETPPREEITSTPDARSSSTGARPPPVKLPFYPPFDYVSPTETCRSLAAHATPAGAFTINNKLPTATPMTPVDVYVTERTRMKSLPGKPSVIVRELSITFTETANECGYYEKGVSPQSANLFTIQAESTTDAPEIGSHVVKGTETEGGRLCLTFEEKDAMRRAGSGAFGGTALGYAKANGTVTITKRTDTTIEGSFDLDDRNGVALKGTFVAPICQSPALGGPPKQLICCGT